MNYPIKVIPYQEDWKEYYEQERMKLQKALDGLEFFFYHIGSTSIPGCAAKPIIDILGITTDITSLDPFAENLKSLGYEILGEYGMKRRRYFRKPGASSFHVFEEADPEVERHLRFCHYLRKHPEEVQTYSKLKSELAKKFPMDIDRYCLEKNPYIKKTDIKAANTICSKLHPTTMTPKKTKWTEKEIVSSMDANMHLQMTYFAKYTPAWEIVFQPDVTVVRSQVQDPTFNYVLSTRFCAHTAKDRIRDIVSLYQNTPFSWWAGPLDTPSDLQERLLENGLTYKEENVGMYVDLSSFVPTSCKDLHFTQALTLDQIQDFCSIFVSIGGSSKIYDKIYSTIPTSLYQEGCSLQMYLGYVDSIPAVTGMLVLHAQCAGIYYVMTHPQMRKQGYGSHMMRHLIQKAKDQGYTLATLQASREGKSLYARLGFQEVCSFKEYAP